MTESLGVGAGWIASSGMGDMDGVLDMLLLLLGVVECCCCLMEFGAGLVEERSGASK